MANKIITSVGRVAAGVAALSLTVAATTASADPRYYYDRDRHRGGDTAAAAIAAGIVGLAVGAAISDSHRNDRYDDRGYYRQGYYDQGYRGYYSQTPGYGYGYGYAPRPYAARECWTTREYDRWNGSYYERTVCR
ncbi:hypothetical protein [uncultured Caulobacter sp.]|uniref:hypothetical protein n=1 Tax=uncultured Caulobacter sp. TaxID=158749 RepID=UPI00262F57A4|nr:hypothetical protein [uncultured Caulobacter sp.]